MTPLQQLKEVLQKSLSSCVESEMFSTAIADGLYSTDLSITALEQWLAIWTQTDSHILTESEINYQEGVWFVSNEWGKLKGE